MSETAATAHERYLQGIPINEELAAVRSGRPVQLPGKPKRTPPPIDSPDRELTTAECAALRELRLHEGWPVLLRLQEKIFRMHQNGAITMSGRDPLGDPQALAKEWAYLGMFRQAMHELEMAMQAEVDREA